MIRDGRRKMREAPAHVPRPLCCFIRDASAAALFDFVPNEAEQNVDYSYLILHTGIYYSQRAY